jgi:septum formation protein
VTRLTLASASPRRAGLLKAWGYAFEALDPAVSEEGVKASSPTRLVELLAETKAKAARRKIKSGVILAADTVVAIQDRVYGKPADVPHAAEILRALSGKSHAVITGVCVMDARTGKASTAHAVSHLKMKPLTEKEIGGYIASGEPMGKAGAYGIQGETGDRWVTLEEGSRTNVVGLPEELVRPMLEAAGVVPG